jgi:hypothetical protein
MVPTFPRKLVFGRSEVARGDPAHYGWGNPRGRPKVVVVHADATGAELQMLDWINLSFRTESCRWREIEILASSRVRHLERCTCGEQDARSQEAICQRRAGNDVFGIRPDHRRNFHWDRHCGGQRSPRQKWTLRRPQPQGKLSWAGANARPTRTPRMSCARRICLLTSQAGLSLRPRHALRAPREGRSPSFRRRMCASPFRRRL